MVDAQHKERNSVSRALAVLAGAAGGGELVCADDVLGRKSREPRP